MNILQLLYASGPTHDNRVHAKNVLQHVHTLPTRFVVCACKRKRHHADCGSEGGFGFPPHLTAYTHTLFIHSVCYRQQQPSRVAHPRKVNRLKTHNVPSLTVSLSLHLHSEISYLCLHIIYGYRSTVVLSLPSNLLFSCHQYSTSDSLDDPHLYICLTPEPDNEKLHLRSSHFKTCHTDMS